MLKKKKDNKLASFFFFLLIFREGRQSCNAGQLGSSEDLATWATSISLPITATTFSPHHPPRSPSPKFMVLQRPALYPVHNFKSGVHHSAVANVVLHHSLPFACTLDPTLLITFTPAVWCWTSATYVAFIGSLHQGKQQNIYIQTYFPPATGTEKANTQ